MRELHGVADKDGDPHIMVGEAEGKWMRLRVGLHGNWASLTPESARHLARQLLRLAKRIESRGQ